jgi:hypothetical protein
MIRRDPPIPSDHKEAKAALLSKLRGDAPYITLKEPLDALTRRSRDFLIEGPDAIRDSLADQLVILEAMMLRFATDATKGPSGVRRELASVALHAQRAFVGTAAALNNLNEQAANAKAIVGNSRPDQG